MNARLSEKISLKRDFDSSQLGESRLKQEISLEARFHSTTLFLKEFHVVWWFRRSFSLQSFITLKTPQSQVVIAHYTLKY